MEPEREPSRDTSLTELREHARRLASDLTGALRRVSVRCGDATIEVEWQPHSAVVNGHEVDASRRPAAVLVLDDGVAQCQPIVDQGDSAETQIVVSSPMVGTFYRSPSQDSAPFVEVGDMVTEGQTVAIVEAMKLFNPIVTESSGVVVEVLVPDGQPVEFDQPLIRLSSSVPADTADAARAGR
ncbi:MAG: acetyl-CoA carboxylase biotin carboxyl carrier protein [Kutzneria sp.]|nr:acetyl-CoA carboxylase biotin carboxyl carrier protein [Kutzneria sp.]